MTQQLFTQLDACIVRMGQVGTFDVHEVRALAAIAVGLAAALSLQASAQLQDLANRVGAFV